jgi:periplasmic protein TonB
MTLNRYNELALNWSLQSSTDRRFHIITVAVVLLMFSAGFILSSIKLPPVERKAHVKIPPRIANFLLEKKKVQPKLVKPKPEPKPTPKPKPKPKPKTEPVVKKIQDKKVDKPLTQSQKKAREKAADSGLLALSNELSDLMDTDSISSMVGAAVQAGSTKVAGVDTKKKTHDLLLADAGKGSQGVADQQLVEARGTTKLTQREISQVKQSLVAQETLKGGKTKLASAKTTSKASVGKVRTEEEISLILDQNKGKLNRLYNRASRKNPGLRGKIIFRITIAASGKVTELVILSSSLNDKSLESSLAKRIKSFNFGTKDVKPVTVNYPIEFLPA